MVTVASPQGIEHDDKYGEPADGRDDRFGDYHGSNVRLPRENSGHALCSVCKNTFMSVALFDLHRAGKKNKAGNLIGAGQCVVHPQALGLVQVDGIWQTQESAEYADERAAKMAKARAARGSK